MDYLTPEQKRRPVPEQYDKFVAKARELFEAGHDLSQEALNVAMDRAREHVTTLGEVSAEQAALFKDYMKRDLEQTTENMSRLEHSAKEHLNPRRVGASALSSLAAMLQQGADSLRQLSAKTNPLRIYREGEIAGAGTLSCTCCGHQEHLEQASTVLICPNCRGKTFGKDG